MSFTGLVGYCWAGAPPHNTMEMSPSATANSLCMPSSSNDVAGKVYPNCRGKLVLATDVNLVPPAHLSGGDRSQSSGKLFVQSWTYELVALVSINSIAHKEPRR